MELIRIEYYGTIDRSFEIHTLKNNNKDELFIYTVEITKGRATDIPNIHKPIISMNGNFNLSPEEYDGYNDAIAGIKSAIIIFVNSQNL